MCSIQRQKKQGKTNVFSTRAAVVGGCFSGARYTLLQGGSQAFSFVYTQFVNGGV